jgi:hypothetical protein
MTAVNWGDGSSPQYFAQNPKTKGSVKLDHSYSAAGTYSDQVVVMEAGAIEEFDGTVTVGSGKDKGAQVAVVPAAPDVTSSYFSSLPAAPPSPSAPTTTSLGASPASALHKQPITFTATVSATDSEFGTPTGTVQFQEGKKVLGTASLAQTSNGAQATLTVTKLPIGADSITATYEESLDFLASTSAPTSVTVSS